MFTKSMKASPFWIPTTRSDSAARNVLKTLMFLISKISYTHNKNLRCVHLIATDFDVSHIFRLKTW